MSVRTKSLLRRYLILKEDINMAKYVDGFVLVVPDSKVAEYTGIKKASQRGKQKGNGRDEGNI
jgi:hypothetical protein